MASSPGVRPAITGVILAGGLGRRMGADGPGDDKGLRAFRGRPMVDHVIERLRPQIDALIISANRNLERWREYGHPVVCDTVTGFVGPLAGVHSGLAAAGTARIVTAPCDCPFLPADLVDRLAVALDSAHAQVAVAIAGGRRQPAFQLIERSALAELEAALARGERRLDAWYAALRSVTVEFDDATAFINLNTPEDLRSLEAQ